MRDTTTIFLVAVITILLAVASACNSERAVDQGIDPRTATLEQVLESTRAAMDSVTSFRMEGEFVSGSSEKDFSRVSYDSYEQQAFGRFKMHRETSGLSGNDFQEKIGTESQIFQRSAKHGWQESEPPTALVGGVKQKSDLLSYFSSDAVRLISRDQVTSDGTPVYRVELVEPFEMPREKTSETKHDLQTRTVIYLIDQESFRLVSMVLKYRLETITFGGSSGSPVAMRQWSESITTKNFFDYDEPIEIEVPSEFVPWSSPASAKLSS